MSLTKWESLIDEAAERCGGQSALAVAIGSTPQNLYAAKRCKRGLTEGQISALAHIVGAPVADVDAIQRVARFYATSPNKAALVGAVALFFSANLSAAVIGNLPDASRTYAHICRVNVLHIVALLRKRLRPLKRAFARSKNSQASGLAAC